jgi:peroxiredoxin
MPLCSDPAALGAAAIDFNLPATDGRTYSLADFSSASVLVVMFICNHCPYVIAIQGRISRLAKDYVDRGVQFVGINANDSVRYPDDNFAAMKVRAVEQDYIFPYLHDESQEVARAYGAVCTPEFYVYDSRGGQRTLRYRGRLDDNWKDEASVRSRELAMALDEIMAGQEPSAEQKPSMGCGIKWKV